MMKHNYKADFFCFYISILTLFLPDAQAETKATNPEHQSLQKREILQESYEKKKSTKASEPVSMKDRRQDICNDLKHRKISYISYYDQLFQLDENCQRIPLDHDQAWELSRRGIFFTDVSHEVIAALPSFSPVKSATTISPDVLCQKFRHKYIIMGSDHYWIEPTEDNKTCFKRLFPDWDSYDNHAGKNRTGRPVPLNITDEDFYRIPSGPPMISVIDEDFRQQLHQAKTQQADLLPLDEACRGLVGKYATYLGEIYFITKKSGGSDNESFCTRRIINGEQFTREWGLTSLHLQELTSSQALSIPITEIKSTQDSAKVNPFQSPASSQKYDN